MNYRTCIYEDGTEKPFEEVKSGDVFQIKEPDGGIVYDTCHKSWFQADSDYDANPLGFTGYFK